MKRFKINVSLKSRSRQTFALMLACALVLGGVAINQIKQVREQSAVMTEVWTPRAKVAEELAAAVREYRISEALRILSVTPEMAEQSDGDLKDYGDLVQSHIAAYRKLLGPGESAKGIDAVATLWSEYVGGNEQMLAFSRENLTAEATDRFRNSASKYYLATNAAEELRDFNFAKGAAANAKAEKIYQEARLEIAALLFGFTILVLIAATYFDMTVWRQIVRMAQSMRRLAEGDLDTAIVGAHRGDELGDMGRAVQVFRDNGLEVQRLQAAAQVVEAQRAQVVSAIATGLSELSAGNLTFRLTEDFAPEFRKLQNDFNATLENMQDTMRVISSGADGIHSSTEEISQASDKLARRTEQQAASLEEAAAALEHITTAVRTSAESAKQAKKAVSSAATNAEQSGEVVRATVSAMSEIERSAHEISEIIVVMDEIAFQTNLLALNAGIEAARAGEAGKGFAVVASEVRTLAQRSTLAAKEIKQLISSSSQHVGSGVNLVAETGKALEQIAAQVAEINGAIGEIASAAEEQAAGLLQVNSTVSSMDKVTQQNAAMSQESTAASHILAQEANELARLIGQFRIGVERAQPPVREPAHRPAPQGRSILRAMSSGNAAVAARLESAISEDGWEEF